MTNTNQMLVEPPCRSLLNGLTAALGTLLLSTGCASSLQVHHAAEPGLEPANYTSYALVDHDVGRSDADVMIAQLVHRKMAQRGFSKSEVETADLLVTVKVLASDPPSRPVVVNDPQRFGGTAGTVGGAEMLVADRIPANQEVDKLVMVQLVDAHSRRIVWVGWAQARVSQDRLILAASKAVSRIMGRIPSRPAVRATQPMTRSLKPNPNAPFLLGSVPVQSGNDQIERARALVRPSDGQDVGTGQGL